MDTGVQVHFYQVQLARPKGSNQREAYLGKELRHKILFSSERTQKGTGQWGTGAQDSSFCISKSHAQFSFLFFHLLDFLYFVLRTNGNRELEKKLRQETEPWRNRTYRHWRAATVITYP